MSATKYRKTWGASMTTNLLLVAIALPLWMISIAVWFIAIDFSMNIRGFSVLLHNIARAIREKTA